MWETLGTVRDLGRLQQIASVLVGYGFGDMVRRIGLAEQGAQAEVAKQSIHAAVHLVGRDRLERIPMTELVHKTSDGWQVRERRSLSRRIR